MTIQDTIAEAVESAVKYRSATATWGGEFETSKVKRKNKDEANSARYKDSNEALAGLIVDAVVDGGHIDGYQEELLVFQDVVKGVLDSYPTVEVDGVVHNVFNGTIQQFAREVAQKVWDEGVDDGINHEYALDPVDLTGGAERGRYAPGGHPAYEPNQPETPTKEPLDLLGFIRRFTRKK